MKDGPVLPGSLPEEGGGTGLKNDRMRGLNLILLTQLILLMGRCCVNDSCVQMGGINALRIEVDYPLDKKFLIYFVTQKMRMMKFIYKKM